MTRELVAISLMSALLLTGCDEPAPQISSTIIVDAVIHNGSGAEPFRGAVRFDGDRIIDIGAFEPFDGETVIDAAGLVLAPGFVDTHSHQDSNLADHRNMPSALSQGITTIVRGADGMYDVAEELSFRPLSDFNASFRAAPAAVNVASFSPHNSIRRSVMGDDNERESSADELAAMTALVASDMSAGALGLSTGLEYEPGIYSSTDELIALASVAAANGGRYMSHLRDEDDRFLEAVDEIIRIGREADLPVKISHIKLADRAFFGTSDKVLEILNNARNDGVDISADIYPYQYWASNLSVLFPDKDFSRRETAEFTFAHTGSPEDILLARFLPNPEYQGKTLAEVSELTDIDPTDLLLQLAQDGDNYIRETGQAGTWIIVKGMQEEDIAAFMQWEFTNICSDGAHNGEHPRGHGSFPRVIAHYVRDLGVLELSEAIHKMSGQSAASMGLAARGRIRTGYFADLVLFDPETIADKATMQDSRALSVGIRKVWVNGVLAFDNGSPTGEYAGRVVLRNER